MVVTSITFWFKAVCSVLPGTVKKPEGKLRLLYELPSHFD